MKKTKLLIATPLMLTPVFAMLPTITSCNKQSEVTLSADFAKNVNFEAISEKMVVGEPYIAVLSIKEDQLGKAYLPNSLTTVKSGDVELWLNEWDVSPNGIYDYYRYYTIENNTKAILYINNISGNLNIEANTTELDHITATPIEITGEDQVEYEVGETANTADRILATATFKNQETIALSDYEIQLDGKTSDYEFKESDVTSVAKTGTISFGGQSDTFKYIINKKTYAYLNYYPAGEVVPSKITKMGATESEGAASAIIDAVDTFNASVPLGSYTINIKSGTYDFGTNTIDIEQGQGKHLTLKSVVEPYYDAATQQYKFNVEFDHSYTATNQYLIDIANTADSTVGSVTISGIQFNAPTTTATLTSPTHRDIVLNSNWALNPHKPHDINISSCKFIGLEDETKLSLDAISWAGSGTSTTNAPINVTIDSCIGQYLNTLYNGCILHDASTLYDLCISDIMLYDSQQLIDVESEGDAIVIVDGVYAEVMYTKEEEATTTLTSGMTIGNAGTYWIRNITFRQLSNMPAETVGGFIRSVATGTPAAGTRQLNLYETAFIAKDNDMHAVLNSLDTADMDWNIKLTFDEEDPQTGIAYGDPDEGQTNYWDPAE